MSVHEENAFIAPWVGPTSCKNTLSVVVLSSNVKILERICDALTEVHTNGNYRWKLIILRSFQLVDIVRESALIGRTAIDFVVIGMDTSKLVCIEWTKKVVAEVHPDLRRRRVILVNASGLPVNCMAVSSSDLIDLQTELKMDMLNANVFKPEDSALLARRLLKYLEVSVGVKTGIPNLNV